ncbi:hypothetical protein [uncultured Helicobacter sp.]|uniref:hypothetical protein n=1 Tax=uncultured Helicobacter sp. TaxID=175537 RepID=UPI00374E7120
MKYFILIFISLITLIIFTSCGLIYTTKGAPTKEQKELVEKYAGLYVFDKKLRDEIIQREKEREEARQKVTLGDTFWEQREAIDNKLPQTLSNGYEYSDGLGYYEKEYEPYYQQIKDYMGEEVFNKLKPDIILTSFYRIKKEKNKEKHIPITFLVEFTWTITTYGLYGDEGAGIRFTETWETGMGGDNIFYLENGKFVKSNEKRKDMR